MIYLFDAERAEVFVESYFFLCRPTDFDSYQDEARLGSGCFFFH